MIEHKETSEKKSMEILRGLALDMQSMDEIQRLKTLEWVVQKETNGKGNRFWLLITKMLLTRPDLIPQALKLSNEKLNYAKVLPLRMDVKQVINGNSTPNRKKFLNFFFQIFSQGSRA